MARTRVVIQARMGSSRLRGKSLALVAGRPLLLRVYESIRAIGITDEIWVATTKLPEDDRIEIRAKEWGMNVFRGPVEDVLARYVGASSDLQDNDCVVRVTADNPLKNPAVNREVHALHLEEKNDYTHFRSLSHVSCEYLRAGALRKSFEAGRASAFDREHVTPYIRNHPELFKVKELSHVEFGLNQAADRRITIDTLEDLLMFEALCRDVEIDDSAPNFRSIYNWLEHHPPETPDAQRN